MNDTAIDQAIAQVDAARAGVRPLVRTFFDGPTFTATHVVYDPETRRAAIIDSVLDFDQPIMRGPNAKGKLLVYKHL